LLRRAPSRANLQNELTPELTPNFTTQSAPLRLAVGLGHQEGEEYLGTVPESLYSRETSTMDLDWRPAFFASSAAWSNSPFLQ